MSRNIAYATEQLSRFFSHNRVRWPQFYESERVIISQLGLGGDHEVLDIGCGCGGLGLALRDTFGVKYYTGIEVNRLAADAARLMNQQAHILCGDFLDIHEHELGRRKFDVVFSLSCIDWNIEFARMLSSAWDRVKPGGHFLATFRLTELPGCDDFRRSHQFINYDGRCEGERAPYVVVNAKALFQMLKALGPAGISAFGYWGKPSVTAVTPYERLCFCAVSVRKRQEAVSGPMHCSLRLPGEICAVVGPSE